MAEDIDDSSFGLSNIRQNRRYQRVIPGELPGIEHVADAFVPPEENRIIISYIDYSESHIETGFVSNLAEFLAQPMPDWVTTRWFNISSPHPYVINQFRLHFGFHTLTAEDVMHIPQRPRVEFFDDYLFVVLRMLQFTPSEPHAPVAESVLEVEQVSLLLYDNVLISFQEKPDDIWKPIYDRLQAKNARIRKNGTGYLLYALLDAMVDHCFPVLEQYGDILEDLELTVLEKPTQTALHRIHAVKRELSLIRRIVWPIREVVDQLYREEENRMGENTKPYLRDVYEHTIQIVEIIESYREMVSGLTDLYMSAVSNRMNEIMKVLTIMSSVFIPLTFISGIYGMNFKYMPELDQRWAYPVIWVVFIVLTASMLFFFKRRGWLGNNE
ncbi:magnesium/cobalt transporter CorA [Marinomonas flavescens]|uniref:magnesium/cobalt transporter CorA n=1 Tax=Marinomonas flavescens TaxID=2529379 RepID=UPI001F0A25F0|nr:magnesium/cobalt transporter CorA [Marinomonas flavescens]